MMQDIGKALNTIMQNKQCSSIYAFLLLSKDREEGGAVTPIAVAITLNGVAIPDSVAIITPAAAEDVWHISTSATITVPCDCCVSVSAAYVDATEDDATVTPTPSIFVRRNASLTVSRTA